MDTKILQQQYDNRQEIQQLEAQITSLKTQLDNSTSHCAQYEGIIRGKEVRHEQELAREKKNFDKEREQLHKEKQHLQQQLELAHETSLKQVEELKEGMTALQNHIKKTTSGLTSENDLIKMKQLRDDNEQLQQKMYDLEEKIIILKQEITSSKRSLTRERERYDNAHSSWLLERTKLEGDIQVQYNEILELKKSLPSSPPHQSTCQSWTTPKRRENLPDNKPHPPQRGAVNEEPSLHRHDSMQQKGEERKEDGRERAQSENVSN